MLSIWISAKMLLHGSLEVPLRSGGTVRGDIAVLLYLVCSGVVGASLSAFPALFATPARAYCSGSVLGALCGTAIQYGVGADPLWSVEGTVTVAIFAFVLGGYGGMVANRVMSSDDHGDDEV